MRTKNNGEQIYMQNSFYFFVKLIEKQNKFFKFFSCFWANFRVSFCGVYVDAQKYYRFFFHFGSFIRYCIFPFFFSVFFCERI